MRTAKDKSGLYSEVVTHCFHGGSHCQLCGVGFEVHGCAIVLFADGQMLGDLCPECAQAGPAGAGERLRERAADLRGWATELESLAPRLLENTGWATVEALCRAEAEDNADLERYNHGTR